MTPAASAPRIAESDPLRRLQPAPIATLGDDIGARVVAEPLAGARTLHLNAGLARELGLTADADLADALCAIADGSRVPAHGLLATVYAGHQFGVWVPQLGDGRAALIGTLGDRAGTAQEIQLKGAGRTPYSRFADGRAVLRSSIREYLISEAMHGLGIPTTRALALIGSDTPVQRERVETAAVVYRVAPSFLRFGHFEFFSHHGRHEALRRLADFAVAAYAPDLHGQPGAVNEWARRMVADTATLMARWQNVGFCHGVMNTDNFSVLGLTIDYGPYGFVDGFDANHICNHSDDHGRYAYGRQPSIGQWNCTRLLHALLPLLDADADRALELANDILQIYPTEYSRTALCLWREKLGLQAEREEDAELVNALLQWMHGCRADFTATLRGLADVPAATDAPIADALLDSVADPESLKAWIGRYRKRLTDDPRGDAERAEAMRAVNPAFVLRNHVAQRVIEDCEAGDTGALHRLMEILPKPFADHPGAEDLTSPPPSGTMTPPVSCSS